MFSTLRILALVLTGLGTTCCWASNWTGEGNDSLWSNPENWSNDVVPLSGNVTIADPFAEVLLDDSVPGSPVLDSLSCTGSLAVLNQSLELRRVSNIDRGLFMANSTLTVCKDPQFDTGLSVGFGFPLVTVLGLDAVNVWGDGPIEVYGVANIDSVNFRGTGTLSFFGALESDDIRVLDVMQTNLFGPCRFQNRYSASQPESSLVIHESAVVDFENVNTDWMTINQYGVLNINKQGDEESVTLIEGPYQCSPTSVLQVHHGELQMHPATGGAQFDGAVVVDADALLQVQTPSSFYETASVTGDGTCRLYLHNTIVETGAISIRHLQISLGVANSVQFDSDFSVQDLTFEGGTIIGPADITVTEQFLWHGGEAAGTGILFAMGETSIIDDAPHSPSLGDTRILWNEGVMTLSDGALLDAANGSNAALLNGDTGTLLFQGEGIVDVSLLNHGFAEKQAGGLLQLRGTIDQQGELVIKNGTIHGIGGGTWGGDIDVCPGALLNLRAAARSISSNCNLHGGGTLELDYGTTQLVCDLNVENTRIVNGDLYVDADINAQNVVLTNGVMRGPFAISVNGFFTLDGGDLFDGAIQTNATALLQNPQNVELRNHAADFFGTTLWTGTGNLTSNGSSQVTNHGFFDIRNAAELRHPFSNLGTTIKTQGGESRFIYGFCNEGAVRIDDGSINVATAGPYRQSLGTTMLAGGDIVSPYVDVEIEGGVLLGGGTIDGSLHIHGGATVDPGELSTDIIDVTEDYRQDGTFVCDLAGLIQGTQHDAIVVDGDAYLSGTLSVQLVDDYYPVPGNYFRVITAASINGEFENFVLPANLPPGITMQVLYENNSIDIKVEASDLLLGDVNRDGVVNLLDVQPFVDLLTAGGYQAEADCNQDGVVNLLDVNAFITILSGG